MPERKIFVEMTEEEYQQDEIISRDELYEEINRIFGNIDNFLDIVEEDTYIFMCSSYMYDEFYNLLDKDNFYYFDCPPFFKGWFKIITGIVARIGHVKKPNRQEFMDAKYKRKNFAKDYLMKGKRW